MNKCTALIPLPDEAAEFRGFERRTDARRAAEARHQREAESRAAEAERLRRKETRRIIHNCKLLFLGMASACCGICAVLAWRASYPALAIFPAALALLAIWAGVRK